MGATINRFLFHAKIRKKHRSGRELSQCRILHWVSLKTNAHPAFRVSRLHRCRLIGHRLTPGTATALRHPGLFTFLPSTIRRHLNSCLHACHSLMPGKTPPRSRIRNSEDKLYQACLDACIEGIAKITVDRRIASACQFPYLLTHFARLTFAQQPPLLPTPIPTPIRAATFLVRANLYRPHLPFCRLLHHPGARKSLDRRVHLHCLRCRKSWIVPGT
jgi:hypothetical protein